MRMDDLEVLKQIQKSTELSAYLIRSVSEKVYDDSMAMELARQSLKYSELHDRAAAAVLEARQEPVQANKVEHLLMAGSAWGSTFWNTSTGHIAELMIRNSTRGLADVWKTLNHHENAEGTAAELAREWMDFEQENIREMKKYL